MVSFAAGAGVREASGATVAGVAFAATARVRVRIAAPRSAASRALRTTRRASSTQQSEYSKPVVKMPGLQRRTGSVRCQIDDAGAGQSLPAAQVIVEEEPDAQHPGRPQARRDAAARSAAAARCAARSATAPRARRAPRARAGNRTARDSAGRRGSAWSSARRCRCRDRPSRTERPTGRVPRRRERCRSR